MKRLLPISLMLIAGCAAVRPTPAPQPPATQTARPAPHIHLCTLDPATFSECFDVPIVLSTKVRSWLTRLQNNKQAHARLETALRASSADIFTIKTELAVGGVPEDLAYFTLMAEPGSPAGPWGLSKTTAQRYGIHPTWWQDRRLDPDTSTRAAAQHFAHLYKRHRNWRLVASQYSRESGYDVSQFMATSLIAKHPGRYGFEDVKYVPERRYDSVGVVDATSLIEVAEIAETTVANIRALNPALTRGCTPPGMGWDIRVPRGTGGKVRDGLTDATERYTCRKHRVRRGETIESIAKKYKTTTYEVVAMNNVRSPNKLRAGTMLAVKVSIVPDPRKPIDRTLLPGVTVEEL